MEKDQQTTPAIPPIPSVDVKAPLKIESAAPVANETHDRYGKKLYILGVIFCVLLVMIIGGIVYLFTQNP